MKMKFTAHELLKNPESIHRINNMLEGVEYIGVGRGIGMCSDAMSARVKNAQLFGDGSATIELIRDVAVIMLITVRDGETLELDTKDKEWHMLSLKVKWRGQ